MKKRLWSGAGACLGMLILILDGRTALEGARAGVELCLKTVIPALFPFFLLSVLLTSSFLGCSFALLRPLGRLFGMPKGGESLLIPALLGGYPVGAQAVAGAVQAGQLSHQAGARLLAFCNNAGPAFLFGIVGPMFPRAWMAWALWGIHIAGALAAALLLPGSDEMVSLSPGKPLSLSAALRAALGVMATVCGWVVLLRVLIAFLSRWMLWLLPTAAQVAVIGLLELSNGCCALLAIEDVPLRFLICSGMLACGGLCVTMQTRSVAQGLSLEYYLPGKLVQTAVSLLLAGAAVSGAWPLGCAVAALFALVLGKRQKKSSIRGEIRV